MNLFINYYLSDTRQDELDECLFQNIENPLIDQIFLIFDRFIHFDSPKVKVLQWSFRPTFQDMYDLTLHSTGINIIANADIYFDETLELAKGIKENEVYALTRWDNGKQIMGWDSQDAWLINGKLKVSGCNFPQAVAGCDNAFAARLQDAGYKVLNPSKDIKAIHLHRGERVWNESGVAVNKPYLLVNPHHLDQETTLNRLI